jgi:hypothetical protein
LHAHRPMHGRLRAYLRTGHRHTPEHPLQNAIPNVSDWDRGHPGHIRVMNLGHGHTRPDASVVTTIGSEQGTISRRERKYTHMKRIYKLELESFY